MKPIKVLNILSLPKRGYVRFKCEVGDFILFQKPVSCLFKNADAEVVIRESVASEPLIFTVDPANSTKIFKAIENALLDLK